MADSESDDGSSSSLQHEGEAAGGGGGGGGSAAEAADAAAGGSAAAGGLAAGDAAAEAAELREYGLSLGVDLSKDADADLKPVVQEAFAAPLPWSWTEHVDEEGRVYFFNQVTQESSWAHPMDNVFKEVLELIQAVRGEDGGRAGGRAMQALQAHLDEVHQRALAQLEGWSGPYNSEAGQYFYNAERDTSSWQNPVDEWQEEIALRQRVLYRCFLGGSAASVDGLVGGFSGALFGGGAAGDAVGALGAQLPRLPLNLAGPRAGDLGPKTPSSTRSFATARSGRSARSVRSARSPGPSVRYSGGGAAGSTMLSPIRRQSAESEDMMMASQSTFSASYSVPELEDFRRRVSSSSVSSSALHSASASAAAPAALPASAPAVAAPKQAADAREVADAPAEDSLELTFGHTEGLKMPKFSVS